MDKNIFSKDLNCKVGDEVFIYSNTYLREWKKTKSVITDISTKFIEVKETELLYTEVPKRFSLKGTRNSKFGAAEVLILISDKEREELLDSAIEKANKVITQFDMINTASVKYCSILFSDEYIDELIESSKSFLKTILKGYTLKELKERYRNDIIEFEKEIYNEK